MTKKLSETVRAEAIKLVEEHGVKQGKVAKELGIGVSTLCKLLKDYRNCC